MCIRDRCVCVCLSLCLYVCVSVCQSVFLSVCLSVRLSVSIVIYACLFELHVAWPPACMRGSRRVSIYRGCQILGSRGQAFMWGSAAVTITFMLQMQQLQDKNHALPSLLVLFICDLEIPLLTCRDDCLSSVVLVRRVSHFSHYTPTNVDYYN